MYEILIKIPGKEEVKARLVPGTYRVGSSPASHLTLQAAGILPRHCQLTATENDLKITDLGGGIEVDGETFREETVHLRPGSSIRLGESSHSERKKNRRKNRRQTRSRTSRNNRLPLRRKRGRISLPNRKRRSSGFPASRWKRGRSCRRSNGSPISNC